MGVLQHYGIASALFFKRSAFTSQLDAFTFRALVKETYKPIPPNYPWLSLASILFWPYEALKRLMELKR